MQTHRNIFYLNTRWAALVEELQAAGDAYVRYVPFGSAIDPVHGYIGESVKAFAQADVNVTRLANAVHPSIAGGRQPGDAVAAFLLADLASASIQPL